MVGAVFTVFNCPNENDGKKPLEILSGDNRVDAALKGKVNKSK